MPLDPAGYQQALGDLPKASVGECAAAWASAAGDYASGILPASTGVPAAQAALQTALVGAFGGAPGAAPAVMDAAFVAFALAIGAGMLPAFVATPPAGPPGIVAFMAGGDRTEEQFASEFASMIDTWMKTGTATPALGGPAVPWT